MAKKLHLDLLRLIQLAYIIRLILGRPLYSVVQDLLMGGGSITDKILAVAVEVLVRLEEEGVEIAVNATVVSYVLDKLIYPAVGHKKLVDLGFADLRL